MNWLNLEIKTLRTPEYIGSDPVERSTWTGLLAYCCEQENGGRIVGARLWKDRQWQQLCGVTKREVDRTTKLLKWEGDDLLVAFYPISKQAEVQAKREAGREGGMRSGEARSLKTPTKGPSTASSCASPDASPTASTEGERKEKGKEGEGEASPPAAPKRAPSATDDEWISEIEAMDCYRPVNVRVELGKALVWAKEHRRNCTRKFFINWLNRALSDVRTISVTRNAPAPSRLPTSRELHGQ